MKNYSEIDWGDFVSQILPSDHVHLSAVILLPDKESTQKIGSIGIDPIILVENVERPSRKSIKFPGTSFNFNILNSIEETATLKVYLDQLGFSEKQYSGTMSYFSRQDELIHSLESEQRLIYMMKKSLIAGVLLKTGYFIDVSSKPFYIDFGENEVDLDSKSFRLFFEATKCITPLDLSNKNFFTINSQKVRLLRPEHYKEIARAFMNYKRGLIYDIKSRLILPGRLRDYIYSGHRIPLFRFVYKN